MIKIAYIIPNIETGGTEKHLLSLIRKIDKKSFSTVLITTAGGGNLYDDFRRISPVYIIGGSPEQARKKPPLNPFKHLSAIIKIAAILRKEKPDIVHCYLPAANSLGPIASKLAGIPKIISAKRSLSDYKKGHPLISKLENVGNFCSDAILANSCAVKEEIKRSESFWSGKIEVIYNGVEIPPQKNEERKKELRQKANLRENAFYAICVSNFFAYKGHEELIKAAAILKERIPELEYIFTGRDAGNLQFIKKMAAYLGVKDKIRFLGEIKNVNDFLVCSDVLVHPSRQEGFSNSILEAMAAGLPVIACNVGGNVESVENGATGILVSKGNPQDLAQALSELAKDRVKTETMGKNGRERTINLFSVDKMADNYENFYKKLL